MNIEITKYHRVKKLHSTAKPLKKRLINIHDKCLALIDWICGDAQGFIENSDEVY